MGAAADLVRAGFGGYAGWQDAEATANFNATGGSGKQTRGGGGSSSGFKSVQAPDIKALQDKVYEQLKPYYAELLKRSGNDLKRATDILHEDYAKGTRQALEDYNRQTGTSLADLKGSMESLGLSFLNEQESKIDNLNKRGMATYDNDPNGLLNSLGIQLPNSPDLNPASANLNTLDVNNPDNSGMGAARPIANASSLGRGGVELGRLQQDQALRQQALQRSANNKIQGLGIDYKRYTNPNATDPSQRGTAENSLNRGIASETNAAQNRNINLNEQLGQNTLNLAQGFAASGTEASKANVSNLYNKDNLNTFINTGV